jgi:hypothetical protein
MIFDLLRRWKPKPRKKAQFERDEEARRVAVSAARKAMRERQDRLLRLTLQQPSGADDVR